LVLDLPKFSGEAREWPSFVMTYRRTTGDCQFRESENMDRLRKPLEGKARQCVKMVLLTNNAERVIEILRRNYGNSDVILNQLIEGVQLIETSVGVVCSLDTTACSPNIHQLAKWVSKQIEIVSQQQTKMKDIVEQITLVMPTFPTFFKREQQTM
jgi:hypothetical protein